MLKFCYGATPMVMSDFKPNSLAIREIAKYCEEVGLKVTGNGWGLSTEA